MPPNIKPKSRHNGPINAVKSEISRNPELEYSFIKRGGNKIENVSGKQTEISTTKDPILTLKYLLQNKTGQIYDIHTHPRTDILSLVPSAQDIINLSTPNIIYVTKHKDVVGQIHFQIKTQETNAFEKFKQTAQKSIIKLYKIEEFEKYKNNKIDQLFITHTHHTNIINELLKGEAGRKYLAKQKSIINQSRLDSEFFSFCTKHRLFNPEELIHYFKYSHLFENNIKILEMYSLLGVKTRYVANKNSGYKFDAENIDFIKI